MQFGLDDLQGRHGVRVDKHGVEQGKHLHSPYSESDEGVGVVREILGCLPALYVAQNSPCTSDLVSHQLVHVVTGWSLCPIP